jgi:hypothetical protein
MTSGGIQETVATMRGATVGGRDRAARISDIETEKAGIAAVGIETEIEMLTAGESDR